MPFYRLQSITNRCQFYRPGDPCFIDKESHLTLYSLSKIRHHYPELNNNIRQNITQGRFTDDQIICCKKHYKSYIEQNALVRRSHSPATYDHHNHELARRFGSATAMSKSIDLSSLSENSSTTRHHVSLHQVQLNNPTQKELVIVYNDSNIEDCKVVGVNKHCETIGDLKEHILKRWSLHNLTHDQLEIYVKDNILRPKRPLESIPVDTRLIAIWDHEFLTVYFSIKPKVDLSGKVDQILKREPTAEKIEKRQTTTEKSSSDKTNITRSSRITSNSDKLPDGLCGLENVGNTCYINSTLQCLSNIPPLSRFFKYHQTVKFVNPNNSAGTKGHVALTYSSLVQDMWSGKLDQCTPTALKQRIDRYTTQFVGHDQHDSQEFMAFLLDALHEDLLYTHHDKSPITELFQGQLETTIHCENNCPSVLTPSTFNFLPLPIPETNDKFDLAQCMKNFLEPELIGNHGKWYCEFCHQKTNARKLTSIKRLPPVLIIQLKRFNTSINQHLNNNKIEEFVDYPLNNLDSRHLVPDLPLGYIYDLVAVSMHQGTLTSGHYSTIAKNRQNNLWYQFDDSFVTLSSEEEVRSRNAYILCYVRKGFKELHLKN